MKKILLSEVFGITRNYLKSNNELDLKMNDFFRKQFSGDFLFTNRGMTAMQALIDDFNLKGSEIIVPDFICSDVFSNLFKYNDITPKIVDCQKNSFKISLDEVKKLVTKKTKAIMIVHTLGIANDEKEFAQFCNKKNIILIENCAHCFSLKYEDKYLGSYGDAAIFSFRSKEVRSFIGGMYLNNRRKINSKVKENVRNFKYKKEDLIRLVNIFKISNIIGKIRKSVAPNAKFSNVGRKQEIYNIPKIGKALICYHLDNFDLSKKQKASFEFYKELKSKGFKHFISEKESKEFSARSFPLMIKNRDLIFDKLTQLGLNPGKGWNPVFSENEFAKDKWKLHKMNNAETYSKEMLAISIDELDTHNIDKIVSLIS